jgi:hypothetical protein
MKKVFLALMLTLFVSPSFCQAQATSMRSLAAAQLFVYGEAIFDRGIDLPEAAIVCSRVLWLEPGHPGAMKIAQKLTKKGYPVHIPAYIPSPVVETPKEVVADKEVSHTEDLSIKEDILKVDEDIQKMRNDVADLREKINNTEKDVL